MKKIKSSSFPLSELIHMDATSIEDFARLISISRAKAFEEIKNGNLKKGKIGDRSVITRKERLRYLDSLEDA